MKKNLFSLLALFCTVQLVHAQIPVTDVAMNTNTIANQISNAITWTDQLGRLKEQASILTKTLNFVTKVSAAVRDVAYAKSLIQRQAYIVDRCSYIIERADKVDLYLIMNLERTVTDFLATNNALVTLVSSTLTSTFKMNDSERLNILMKIKMEQSALLEQLHTTDMILSTVISTEEVLRFQIFN